MKKIAVSLRIDVTKIDKARLYKGEKGTYLDAVAFIDLEDEDQYGNAGMITQAVSKEEKAAGDRGKILGNSKIIWRDEGQAPQARQAPRSQQAAPRNAGQPQASQPTPADDFDTDIPF